MWSSARVRVTSRARSREVGRRCRGSLLWHLPKRRSSGGRFGVRKRPVDRASGHAEVRCDLRDRAITSVVGFAHELHLTRCELWLLSAGAAACAGCGQAVHRALVVQLTLELSDGADDLKEQSPRGRAGVDALLQDNEVDAALLQCRGQLQQVLEAASEPVEFRDHERVAGPQLGYRSVEFGAGLVLSGGVLDEQPLAAVGLQDVRLPVGVLLARRVDTRAYPIRIVCSVGCLPLTVAETGERGSLAW